MHELPFWHIVKAHLNTVQNQKWLAGKIGIPESSLSAMMGRNSMPKADIAYRIASTLSLDLGVLLGLKPADRMYSGMLSIAEEEPSYLVRVDGTSDGAFEPEESLEEAVYVHFLARMAPGIPRERIGAVSVKGDAMKDATIIDGDVVFYVKGIERKKVSGLYAIRLKNDFLIKFLDFNLLEGKVTLISANARYAPVDTDPDNPEMEILGEVVGWMHRHIF